MTLEATIGYTIRSIRMSKGVFAKDVAARVPMSASYLCEIERNEAAPSILMLADIAKALGLEVSELWYAIYKNLGGTNGNS
jgi:transcriptional regulator with XRE-family HTH domain